MTDYGLSLIETI